MGAPPPRASHAQLQLAADLASAWVRLAAASADNAKLLAGLSFGQGLGRLWRTGAQGLTAQLQHQLTINIHAAARSRLLQAGSNLAKARLLSISAKHASSYLTALRVLGADAVIFDDAFRLILKLRLGMALGELAPAQGKCPVRAATAGKGARQEGGLRDPHPPCGGALDSLGHHLLGTCRNGSTDSLSGRSYRHNALVELLARISHEEAGLDVRWDNKSLDAFMEQAFGRPPPNSFFWKGDASRPLTQLKRGRTSWSTSPGSRTPLLWTSGSASMRPPLTRTGRPRSHASP